MVQISVNGENRNLEMDADAPLLWALRDGLGLGGTKFGCGIGLCGACIVLLDGRPARSCITPLSAVAEKRVTTIEGLSKDRSHPVQQAWIAEEVPQCGYCQSGQILAAVALLAGNPKPGDADIDAAMRDVLCRCGTYPRIRKAIHKAARLAGEKSGGARHE
jgi:aerobic-type carbon monoxide dehydrogenase small subunit (CoxS/CutS family)